MSDVVGVDTEIMEHELSNSYDRIMRMTKKKIEDKDNEDHR